MFDSIQIRKNIPLYQQAVVAERLRRLTRNQIPSGSVGSNPTDREYFYIFHVFLFIWIIHLYFLLYMRVIL